MTFAVAGATGRTGRVVAETLLARGAKVRVIVRDPSAAATWQTRGAEVAVAELGEARALTRALAGATGAYLLIPPDFGAPSQRAYQDGLARSFAHAVTESGIAHVVLLSGFAAHHDNANGPLAGLHTAERLLGAIPTLRLSAIRAGYFDENVIPSLGNLRETGILPSFFPANLGIPMVATRDVGPLAAELLLDPTANGPVELGSDVTHAEIARTLAHILERPIRVEELALDTIAPMLRSLGFTADLAGLYVDMIAGIRSGALVFEGGHRRVAASTSMESVLRPLFDPHSK